MDFGDGFIQNVLIIWNQTDDCSTGIQSFSQQGSMITAFAWPLTLTVGENHELLLVGHGDGTVSCVRVTPSGHITSEDLPHCAQPNCKNAKKALTFGLIVIFNFLARVSQISWFSEEKDFAIAYTDGTIKFGRLSLNSSLCSLNAHRVNC